MHGHNAIDGQTLSACCEIDLLEECTMHKMQKTPDVGFFIGTFVVESKAPTTVGFSDTRWVFYTRWDFGTFRIEILLV